MTLQEFCDTLPKERQIELAINFAKQAVPIWEKYAESNPLSYRDTVVGLTHTIPKQLLADTINEVQKHLSTPKLLRSIKGKSKLLKLYSYFSDPVVALQDTDWEPPTSIEKTFYAVYNLIGSIVDKEVTAFNERTIYVSINQAIDAIQTAGILSEKEIKEILKHTKNGK